MRTLVIWHNLNKDTYYYKFYRICNYIEGDRNQYNHQVILILNGKEVQPIIEKVSLRKTLLTPLIRFNKWIGVFLEKFYE